jgi:hypothetical protein
VPSGGLYVAVENLRVIKDRAAVAGPAVARAMAKHGQAADRRVLLRRVHPAHTRTPSPPGSPPASITGRLAASIATGDATPIADQTWEATAGPTRAASSNRGPYGRFLEFGGVHVAHTQSGMHWYEDGRWHMAHWLVKEPRPYLAVALEEIIADGSLHDAAVAAFIEVT